MTPQYMCTIAPPGQAAGDGRPPSLTELDLVYRLAFQRKSVISIACLLLILLCYIFAPTFSSNPLVSYDGSEEHPEFQLDISPSAPDIIQPRLDDAFSVGGCNIWRGEWIPHSDGPAYTNTSCQFIHDHQNCIKNGRPDLDFLYWRWKPYDCELPLFDAKAFLKIAAGKKWVFIGDSMARNNLQSVLCLLSQVEIPEYNSDLTNFYFTSYNLTLALVWAPFLVQFTEDKADGFAQYIPKLYLDVVHKDWGSSLHTYDYIVLSTGHWYTRPSVYFVQDKLVGSLYLPASNVTDVGFGYGYRAALRTVFDFMISSGYKGAVFFRTVSPSHWENGLWNEGGNCTRKAPSKSKSITLEDSELDMYKIQLEEFAKTVQRSSEFSFKLKIVDGTQATLLRPDAHPGPYGYFHSKIKNDCLHWCLPGAIDTWSAMLLDVLRHL